MRTCGITFAVNGEQLIVNQKKHLN